MIAFLSLLGVVGIVGYCGTRLLLEPPAELSGVSVRARQLGSIVFHLSYLVAALVICAHLDVP